ncbi:MAG: hypothetical protein JWQ38_1694 [Flavipsychrobacter sp.]|nr:hypothetical protein [Flavipsychrobacter sp.]
MSTATTITLLSDLGTRDASVTVAKATLMRLVPGTTVIDLSHNVKPYDLQQAAYFLLSAYSHFMPGTIHVSMVDIFGGHAPRMVLAGKDGHYFIAPDNGLLSLAFGSALEGTWACFDLERPFLFSEWVTRAGKVIETIRATDGHLPFTSCDVRTTTKLLQPKVTQDSVECNILYIDRYENIVLDITRSQFREIVQDRPFRIMLRKVQDITSISNNYSDVPHGDALCRFNNSGFLEIALNHDHAASLLGFGAHNMGVRYPTINIFF